MATKISTALDDSSRAGIQLELKDAAGATVSAELITSINYTWSDTNGNVINSRDNVALTVANPATIILNAADTVAENSIHRLLTVTWVYDDTVLGTGTPKTEEYEITLNNFINK